MGIGRETYSREIRHNADSMNGTHSNVLELDSSWQELTVRQQHYSRFTHLPDALSPSLNPAHGFAKPYEECTIERVACLPLLLLIADSVLGRCRSFEGSSRAVACGGITSRVSFSAPSRLLLPCPRPGGGVRRSRHTNLRLTSLVWVKAHCSTSSRTEGAL